MHNVDFRLALGHIVAHELHDVDKAAKKSAKYSLSQAKALHEPLLSSLVDQRIGVVVES